MTTNLPPETGQVGLVYTLGEAEHEDGYGAVIKSNIPPGAIVDLTGGLYAVITEEGLACDCGKGVMCPLNPQLKAAAMLNAILERINHE